MNSLSLIPARSKSPDWKFSRHNFEQGWSGNVTKDELTDRFHQRVVEVP